MITSRGLFMVSVLGCQNMIVHRRGEKCPLTTVPISAFENRILSLYSHLSNTGVLIALIAKDVKVDHGPSKTNKQKINIYLKNNSGKQAFLSFNHLLSCFPSFLRWNSLYLCRMLGL